MKIKILSAVVFLALLAPFCHASGEPAQEEIKGSAWLKMSDAEKLDYIMVRLYALAKEGVQYSGTPDGYRDAISKKFDKRSDFYNTNISRILNDLIYETEPGTREVLGKLRRNSERY